MNSKYKIEDNLETLENFLINDNLEEIIVKA